MKKLVIVFAAVVLVGISVTSCTPTSVEDDEIYSVDRGEIERPRDQGSN